MMKKGYYNYKNQSRLYRIYYGIIQRCTNPKTESYDNYGGRGIGVCAEWMESFNTFADWALKNGYADDLQIDRINNYKGYYPNNCRWVTCKENANNKRIHDTSWHVAKDKDGRYCVKNNRDTFQIPHPGQPVIRYECPYVGPVYFRGEHEAQSVADMLNGMPDFSMDDYLREANKSISAMEPQLTTYIAFYELMNSFGLQEAVNLLLGFG